MQNHGGYSQSTLKGYEPDVKLNYETEYPEAQTYLSLARESDKAFQNLVEYFEKVDEPTMIVMFGDHWPKLEEGFLAEVLGKDREKLDLFESQVTYTTPYVIWTIILPRLQKRISVPIIWEVMCCLRQGFPFRFIISSL